MLWHFKINQHIKGLYIIELFQVTHVSERKCTTPIDDNILKSSIVQSLTVYLYTLKEADGLKKKLESEMCF